MKNYTESSGSYKFLHKDYLGSVLAITDESGNIVEQRHYDAWGQFTHLKVGNGAIITDKDAILNLSKDLIIDRGYTSHEHLNEVGLIHMNGRLYDPVLRRFLNADENIQDMFNTQNYNKYGYVLNNPLMFNDPSGEFLFVAFVAALSKAVFTAVAIAAAVDITVGLVKGSWSINGFFNSLTSSAVSAIASFGIGEIFQLGSVSKFFGASKFFFQAIAHGASQGALSVFFGGNFWSGATAAAFASLSASAAGSNPYAQIVAGAISGGIGSVLAGGNFWQGAATGLIVAGLNHAMHKVYPPKGFKGEYWKDSDGEFTRNADGSYNVTNSSEDVGKYSEIEEVVLYGKSKLSQNLDNAANGLGINVATKESLFNYAKKAGELGKGAEKYLKYTKILGRVTGIYGAGSSIYDAYRNPTTGNILKATFNTGMLFLRVNPIVGLGIGILDATGVTNQFFNGVGNFIDR